jgi:hypothetical protein
MATKSKNTGAVCDEARSEKPMTADELQAVRNQVANVIAKGAVVMTERIVQSLKEGGSATNATTMKFLFELAGLYPAEPAESDEQESLAKILMQRLGFSEDTMPKVDEDAEE